MYCFVPKTKLLASKMILRYSLFNIFCLFYVIQGSEYGKDWIYFPDGDDNPHYVDLTQPFNSPALRIGQRDYSHDIEYRLYTKNNKDKPEILNSNGEIVEKVCDKGCFIPNRPVKIVTHGWRSSADNNAVMLIKNAYIETHGFNVIGVDWSAISMSYVYPTVALETKKVGEVVGQFIDALANKYGIKGNDIHLIGHSLGAHVMGNAASTSKLNISRITGLDPARPMFEIPWRSEEVRLDPTDAQFVDVLHTCAGILGVESSTGHADFYPNNGISPQPGCYGVHSMMEACSHSRAHKYFAEAIESPQSFPAYRCKDWNEYMSGQCKHDSVYMGEGVDRNLRGVFYLRTNSFEPFGESISNIMPTE